MTHSPIDRAIDAVRRHMGDRACREWEPVLRGFATLDGSTPALRAISQAPSDEVGGCCEKGWFSGDTEVSEMGVCGDCFGTETPS